MRQSINQTTTEAKEEDTTVYMRMTTIKKGRGETKPEKGQKIGCYYKGHFDNPDGKIFDQLQPKSRGSQPLSFKGKDWAVVIIVVAPSGSGIIVVAPLCNEAIVVAPLIIYHFQPARVM